jgi:hypothetical protein
VESRELVNLYAVAQAFEPIQLAHFMAVILPDNIEDRDQILDHARALIAQLRHNSRFSKVFARLFTYPITEDLIRELEQPTLRAHELRSLFIDGIFQMVWSAMGDEGATLKEIRERMVTLAADLLVKKYKSMGIRARKEWRFEDRAAWVRQELAKHNPRYSELCTDSVLHREIIRIVTMVLKEDGVWMRARRRRLPKEAVPSDAS